MTVRDHEDYELFCRGELSNPYPFFARLREESPVHWSEVLNSWIFTSYENVSSALSDHQRLSSARLELFMNNLPEDMRNEYHLLKEHQERWLVYLDRPQHTNLRRLLNKAFSPRAIGSLQHQIRQLVDELIDKVFDVGRMDIIKDFAYPLPAIVIATMLGIPAQDRDIFKAWSDDISSFVGGSRITMHRHAERAHASLVQLIEYMEEHVADHRKHPQDDLTSMLIAVEDEGDTLTVEDIIATCNLFLVAGHETTTGLLGNGVLSLIQHSDQLERLRMNPSMIDTAIEEILRWESPLQRQTRLVAEDFILDGQRIVKGQTVMLMQGAANRDPKAFNDPEMFDIGRKENAHLAFGRGIHFCLGAPLARLEGRIAIPRLFERLKRISIPSETPLAWRSSMNFRSLMHLPVEF